MAREKLWTVEQIASYLLVSERSVQGWLRAGKLKGFRVGGDRAGWRVEEADLERFIAELKGQTAGGGGS